MTCQWCKRYRRRGGRPVCLIEDENGELKAFEIHGRACPSFVPRRICTTCAHRCDQDEVFRNTSQDGGCRKWRLKTLASWGGRRIAGPFTKPVWGDSEEVPEGI